MVSLVLLAVFTSLSVAGGVADAANACLSPWTWSSDGTRCWQLVSVSSCPDGSRKASIHSGSQNSDVVQLLDSAHGIPEVETGGTMYRNKQWGWDDGSQTDFTPAGFLNSISADSNGCISLKSDGTWKVECVQASLCALDLGGVTSAVPALATTTPAPPAPTPAPTPATTSAAPVATPTTLPPVVSSEAPAGKTVVSLYRFSQQDIAFTQSDSSSSTKKATGAPFVVYASADCSQTEVTQSSTLFALVTSCDSNNLCRATPTPEVYKSSTLPTFCLYAATSSSSSALLTEISVKVQILPFQIKPSTLSRVDQPELGAQYPVMTFASDEVQGPMQYIFYTILVDAPTTALISMYEATRLDFFLADGPAGCQAGNGGSEAISVISALDWMSGGAAAAASDASTKKLQAADNTLQYRIAVASGDVASALTYFKNATLCVVDTSEGDSAKGSFVSMLRQSPQSATLLVPTTGEGPGIVAGQSTQVVYALTTLSGMTVQKAAKSLQLRIFDVSSARPGKQCRQAIDDAYVTGVVAASAAGVLLSFKAPMSSGKALLCLYHMDTGAMLHFHEHKSHFETGLHLPVVVTIKPATWDATSAPSPFDDLTVAGIKQVHMINGAQGNLPLANLVSGQMTTLINAEGSKVYYVDCAPTASTSNARCPQGSQSSRSEFGIISNKNLPFRKAFTVPASSVNQSVVAKCLCARFQSKFFDMKISLLLTKATDFALVDQKSSKSVDKDGANYELGDDALGVVVQGPSALVGGYYALQPKSEGACNNVVSSSFATQLQSPNATLWLLGTSKPTPGEYVLCYAPETTTSISAVVFYPLPLTVYKSNAPPASDAGSSSAPAKPLSCTFFSGAKDEKHLKLPCTSSAVMLKCDLGTDEPWWSSVPSMLSATAARGTQSLACDNTTPQGRANCMWKQSKIAIDASAGIVLFRTRSAPVQQACQDSTLAPTNVNLQFAMSATASGGGPRFTLDVAFHSAMTNQQSPNPWLWSTSSTFSSIPDTVNVYHALGGVPMKLTRSATGCASESDSSSTASSFYLNADLMTNTKLPNLVQESGKDMQLLYLCLYVPLTGKWTSLTQRNRQDPDMKTAKGVFVLEGNNRTEQTVAVECRSTSSAVAMTGVDSEETPNLCTVDETQFMHVTQRCLGQGKKCSLIGLSSSDLCYASQILWTGDSYRNLGNDGQLSIPSADLLATVKGRLTSTQKSATFYWCTQAEGSAHWEAVVANKQLGSSITINKIDVPELDSLRHLSLPLRNAEPFDLVLTDQVGLVQSAGLFLRTSSAGSGDGRCAPGNLLGAISSVVPPVDSPSDYATISFTKTSTSPSNAQLTALKYNMGQIDKGPIWVDLCVSALTTKDLNAVSASSGSIAGSQVASSVLVPASVSIKLSAYATPLTSGVFLLVYYALDQVHYKYEDPTSHVFNKTAGKSRLSRDVFRFLTSQPDIKAAMKTEASSSRTTALGIRAVGARTFRVYIPSALVGGRQLSIDGTRRLYKALEKGTFRLSAVNKEWIPVQVQGRYLANQSAVDSMPSLKLVEPPTTDAPTPAPLDGADGMNASRTAYAVLLLVVLPVAVGVALFIYKKKQAEKAEIQAAKNVEEGAGGEAGGRPTEPSPAGTEMQDTPHISPSPVARRPAIESAADLLREKQNPTAATAAGAPPATNTNDTGENPLYDDPGSRDNSTVLASPTQPPRSGIATGEENTAVSDRSAEASAARSQSTAAPRGGRSGSRASTAPVSGERDPLEDSDDDAK